MQDGVVALLIQADEKPQLMGALSDLHEIELLEEALQTGTKNPLAVVLEARHQKEREDEEFGDYLEDLLCQPFLRPDIQDQALEWMKAKIKIEKFQKSAREATRVIAEYAYQVYCDNRARKEFMLSGSTATVMIRVIEIPPAESQGQTPRAA